MVAACLPGELGETRESSKGCNPRQQHLPERPASASDAKQLGDAAFGQGDFDQAVAAYTAALDCLTGPEDDPHMRGTLLANRCLARLKLGNLPDAARADAQEACRMRPRWGKAHLRLAQSEEGCGRLEAAAASYQRAAELDAVLAPAVSKALAALERQSSRQRCLVTLQGHQGPIYDAAMHPKDLVFGSVPTQLVATVGADATVRLWCSTTGRQLQVLNGHSDRVTRLCWSMCGSLLATASLDGTTRLWHLHPDAPAICRESRTPAALVTPGSVFGEAGQEGRVSCLTFSPDSTLLATGSSSGHVRLWSTRVSDDSSHQELGRHSGLVSSVCFSPCGHLLASASGDGQASVWSAESGKNVAEIVWDSGPINCCCFVQLHSGGTEAEGSPQASALLLTCHVQQLRREGRVMLWDVLQKCQGWVDGKLVGPVASLDDFRGKVTGVDSCCYRTEGRAVGAQNPATSTTSGFAGGASAQKENLGDSTVLLAAACSDGSVRVVDLAAVAAVPAGNRVAAVAAGAPLLELMLPDAVQPGHGDPSWHVSAVQQASHDRNLVALSPDGSLLAAVGPDCRIRLVELESTGQAQQVLALAAHSNRVRVLCWLRGGRRLLSAGEDGIARVWQARP